MTTVLVTGGTGVLGRAVVAALRYRGADVRVLTRKPGDEPGWVRGDLETGEGVAEAVADVDAVAHCASGADWMRPQRDVAQTRNLLAALRTARPHLVYISIVGVDRIRFGYYRAKHACERMIESSGLPWTVLRATQFHELVLTAGMFLTKGPVALSIRGIRDQPVDVGEVAQRMAGLVLAPPAGRAPDVGGPQVEDFSDLIRQYLTVTRRRKPVLSLPLFGRAAADFRAGHHLLGPQGERGQVSFADFLRSRVQEDGSVAAPYDLRRRP
jgi:uncharacterized protein YbjT (DUF2867 family)